jgi:hypothetical protein
MMFSDLVGSTALSTRHDPEDLRELIGDYHRAVAETVGRFDGFVAKYMGDGVLIYFGYPRAHEDDAEWAVRAGLAVIDAVEGLAAPEPFRVRLGIAGGLVVVGDLIGAGAAQERGLLAVVKLRTIEFRFAVDSPVEGTGFEPSVPLLRKALLGVANRRRRHERPSHLQVQVRRRWASMEPRTACDRLVSVPDARCA